VHPANLARELAGSQVRRKIFALYAAARVRSCSLRGFFALAQRVTDAGAKAELLLALANLAMVRDEKK